MMVRETCSQCMGRAMSGENASVNGKPDTCRRTYHKVAAICTSGVRDVQRFRIIASGGLAKVQVGKMVGSG